MNPTTTDMPRGMKYSHANCIFCGATHTIGYEEENHKEYAFKKVGESASHCCDYFDELTGEIIRGRLPLPPHTASMRLCTPLL